jgi:hypothetical protein
VRVAISIADSIDDGTTRRIEQVAPTDVTLSTSAGTFLGGSSGTLKIRTTGTDTVLLIPPRTLSTIRVEVVAGPVVREILLVPEPAYPDEIVLLANPTLVVDSSIGTPGTPIALIAHVTRSTGSVSLGIPVTIEIDTDAVAGSFTALANPIPGSTPRRTIERLVTASSVTVAFSAPTPIHPSASEIVFTATAGSIAASDTVRVRR